MHVVCTIHAPNPCRRRRPSQRRLRPDFGSRRSKREGRASTGQVDPRLIIVTRRSPRRRFGSLAFVQHRRCFELSGMAIAAARSFRFNLPRHDREVPIVRRSKSIGDRKPARPGLNSSRSRPAASRGWIAGRVPRLPQRAGDASAGLAPGRDRGISGQANACASTPAAHPPASENQKQAPGTRESQPHDLLRRPPARIRHRRGIPRRRHGGARHQRLRRAAVEPIYDFRQLDAFLMPTAVSEGIVYCHGPSSRWTTIDCRLCVDSVRRS
jgi:hypothetical protein